MTKTITLLDVLNLEHLKFGLIFEISSFNICASILLTLQCPKRIVSAQEIRDAASSEAEEGGWG